MNLIINPRQTFDAITIDGELYQKGVTYKCSPSEGKKMKKLARRELPIFVVSDYDEPEEVVDDADNAETTEAIPTTDDTEGE